MEWHKKESIIVLKPAEFTCGYRWVVDSSCGLHIVTIRIDGEYYQQPYGHKYDYMAMDWTIIDIKNVHTGKTIDRIPGRTRAIFKNNVDYHVGNQLKNEIVFFCLSLDDLQRSQGEIMNRICQVYKTNTADERKTFMKNIDLILR